MKQTRLNAYHKKLGAKMIEFFDWEMPLEFKGIIDEHLAVRQHAGLFDVSHMGEILISRPGCPGLRPVPDPQRRFPAGYRPGPIHRPDNRQGDVR